MGPAHPASYPTVPGALSPGIKWLGHEADHLPPAIHHHGVELT